MQKFKIIKVNKGIANRYPNYTIEINNKLYSQEYKPLLSQILKHETEHTDKGWSYKDLLHDLKFNPKGYWKFVFTTPNSWWQFAPIYKSSFGKWFFDNTLLLTYGILAISIGGLGWIIT